jgi:non-specific serine/threonine protein kinase
MRMLEMIRDYARTRLRESGEADDVGARHDAYFDRFVHDLRAFFEGSRAPEAMARLDDDWDNIAATVPWRLAARDYASLVRLATSTWRYIWLDDRVREAMAWMEPVYDARTELEPAQRGELCRIWSSALYQVGEYTRAKDILDEAVEILAETGPRDREAWARTINGALLPHFDPDLERALAELTRAIEIFRDENADFGLGTALGISGTVLSLMGRVQEGAARIDEAVEAAERVGLPALIGANRTIRALASLSAGDVADARRRLEEAASTPLYLEGTALCLEALAAIARAEGDTIQAATAYGAAESLREQSGIQMWPTIRLAYEEAIAALAAAGPEVQAARYEGRRMSPRDVFTRYLSPAVAVAA